MKNNLLTLATILTIGLFTNNVTAQAITQGDLDQQATANARLVKLMTLSEDVQLDFGTILLGAAAAEVITLNPDTEALSGGINHLASTTGGQAPTAGLYSVTGTKNAVYAVTLPLAGSGITVANGVGGPDNIMKIDNLQLKFGTEYGALTTATTNKLDGSGDDTFKLGGDLHISATQQEGVYTGKYDVSVDYN